MSLSALPRRELIEVRYALAAARFAVAGMRVSLALRRFNPGQARLPAGSAGGGRWTAGGGAGGPAVLVPVSSRPRSASGATRVIRGRVHEVTPGQQARLDVTAAQARAAIREV